MNPITRALLSFAVGVRATQVYNQAAAPHLTSEKMDESDFTPGPPMGSYNGRPIYEWVMVKGARHMYHGPAKRNAEGKIYPSQFQPGDFLAAGVVYKREVA